MITHIVEVVDNAQQRYPTAGDYSTDIYGCTHFRISRMANPDHQFLVAIHEIIEAYLCQRRGIKESEIDKFDINWERERLAGDTSEPGNNPEAPYYFEHKFATKVEMDVAHELGVDWDEYEKALNNL